MYCPQCGTQGSGNFCANCGTRLPTALATATAAPARGDWSSEVSYELLMAHPDVRERLARAAERPGIRISAEQCLKLYDTYLAKAVKGLPMSDLASVVVPIFARLGISAAKQRSEWIQAPVGRAIVAVLCSLAARGQTIRQVHQAQDGCAIEAVLPSDLWSWEGTLFVTVVADGNDSHLEARTKIGGQMYDWGKGNRSLEHLIEDVRSFR